MICSLALPLVLSSIPAVPAETPQEPPGAWGGSVGPRITVEVEAEPLPDKVRFTYTVRNLSEPVDGPWPAIVSLLIGSASDSDPSELTAMPTDFESPPGWEAEVIADNRTTPRTWRLKWSCNQHGWDEALKHHIKAGDALSGFRVSASSGDSTYLTAAYTVGLDAGHGISIERPLGLSGRPLVKKVRH